MSASSAATRVAVCIDDLGLHGGITEAAVELVAAGRVSALACLSEAPGWRAAAAVLRAAEVVERTDLGLHLCFTEEWSRSSQRASLTVFIARAFARRLDAASLLDDVRRQLDAFEDAVGAPPHFVDGHQHVHQLPIIRDVLLAELGRRYADTRPWLRNTLPPKRPMLAAWSNADDRKHRIIAALGAGRFRALALRHGFAQNQRLLGVYGFEGSTRDYAQRWQRWSREAGDLDLLMCHPGRQHASDPIGPAREAELHALREASTWEAWLDRAPRIVRLSNQAHHGAV